MADLIPSDVDKLLDPSMHKELFETVVLGAATYYFVDQYDDDSGEPVIVRRGDGQVPQIVDDILPGDQSAGGAATEVFSSELQVRLKAIRGVDDEVNDASSAGGGGLLTQDQLNKKFRGQAERCADSASSEHLSSADAPGTNHGRLACAWAVNQVAKKALGKQIGGGLATAEMVVVLRANHVRSNNLVSGCVIISPTVSTPQGRNIGHVGIIGAVDHAQPGMTKIYSNSSGRARFEQNFTFDRWVSKYRDEKGLSVEFFALAPSLFPTAGA